MYLKKKTWYLHLCVFLCVCVHGCIYVCKCLSLPEQARAARSCLINTVSSSSWWVFVSEAFLLFILWSSFLLPAGPAFCSSQCRHERPKTVGDIRVKRAPGRDGPPSAFAVPQLVSAVDGQALQVVPSAAAASSGSRGPRSTLSLGQLWFCWQAKRGKC